MAAQSGAILAKILSYGFTCGLRPGPARFGLFRCKDSASRAKCKIKGRETVFIHSRSTVSAHGKTKTTTPCKPQASLPRLAKHGLSHRDMPPFTMQKAMFCNAKGGILDCKEYAAVCFIKALQGVRIMACCNQEACIVLQFFRPRLI